MNAAFPLLGRKVTLLPFTADDITEDYIGWLNDAVVTRFSNQRFVRHDRPSCQRYLTTFDGTPNLFVSVRRIEDNRPIGTMTAYVAPQHGTADIGILIGDRTAWGHGFGRDAWTTLAEHLSNMPGMRKLTCGTLACNEAMIALAKGCGMHVEARRIGQELVDGQPVDVIHFARFVA